MVCNCISPIYRGNCSVILYKVLVSCVSVCTRPHTRHTTSTAITSQARLIVLIPVGNEVCGMIGWRGVGKSYAEMVGKNKCYGDAVTLVAQIAARAILKHILEVRQQLYADGVGAIR